MPTGNSYKIPWKNFMLWKHENSKDSEAKWGIYMSVWTKKGKVGNSQVDEKHLVNKL